MNLKLKEDFNNLLRAFIIKSIDEVKNTQKNRKFNIYEKVDHFYFESYGSGGTSYGYKKIDILNDSIIPSLYCNDEHFLSQEAYNLAKFIIDTKIYNRIIMSSGVENIDPNSYVNHYLIRFLEDYLEIVNKYMFSEKAYTLFFERLIAGITNDYYLTEMIIILPNLVWPNKGNRYVDLGDGFQLLKLNDTRKAEVINSFKTLFSQYGNINFNMLYRAECIVYKKLRLERSRDDNGKYLHEFYDGHKINKEMIKGIDIAKKISIYHGKHTYVSNIFYRGAISEAHLKNIDWRIDPHMDFFTPNLISGQRCIFLKGLPHFKKIYNKMSGFQFDNFQVPLGRYLSALEKEKEDRLNSILDYIIMLESLLLETKIEIKFQFALYGSLFFGKKKSEKERIFDFFKKIYDLRSDLVHGNDGRSIKKALKRLNEFDPGWQEKLRQYSADIILFLIKNKIQSKKDLIDILNKKLHS